MRVNYPATCDNHIDIITGVCICCYVYQSMTSIASGARDVVKCFLP